jgi:hypothetical protein
MADVKISGLPASTVPLAGTEVLPIVQGGQTRQVSVNNLTAGKDIQGLGLTLTSTDAGASQAPTIDLYRDSASPAASDTIGEIEFNGEDSAGNKQAYALLHGSILSPTSGAEQGQIHFETATAGALTEKMIIGTTNLVINEIGAIFNVRIEGDTDANLFYTDATNSRIGVGTVSPAEKLDVVGKIQVSDNVVIATSGKGIDFSATAGTGTSELLADYEEGTFDPVLTTDGTNFTSVTYSSERGGRYIKVGSVVHFQLTVRTTAVTVGSASGNVLIGGLPFTAATSSVGQNGNSVCVGGVSVSWVVANPVFGVVQNNSANILLYVSQAAVTAVVANVGTGAGANYLQLTGTYVAA